MVEKEILLRIIKQFHDSRNIIQKRDLNPILAKIEKEGYKSDQIYASIGEDAAAIKIDPNSDELILLSTDAILPSFIRNSPYAAGVSAVYVGLDDIYACGGEPLAISVTMEYGNNELGKELLQGILDATQKFKIPLVRGHTVTDSLTVSLTSTIVGRTNSSEFISIKNNHENDIIYFVLDPDGSPGEKNKLYWNTILNADPTQFKEKRKWIKNCHRNGWFHCCKDISNGGILGTVYQMMRFSHLGAIIDLKSFEHIDLIKKAIYTIEELCFAYLTSSFIISGPPESKTSLMNSISHSGMSIYPIGMICQKGYLLQLNGNHFSLIND